MERSKEALALAPLLALAFAVVYLEGYWGAFDILPFPYLSFQELLAYAAPPLFGILISLVVGTLLGVWAAATDEMNQTTHAVSDGTNQSEQKRAPAEGGEKARRLLNWVNIGLQLCIGGLLVYRDDPFKWLIVPLAFLVFAGMPVLSSRVFQKLPRATVLTCFVAISALILSFGYGRMKAEQLLQRVQPNVSLTVEGEIEVAWLIGRIGGHYFYFNALRHVTVLPESAVTRVEYLKEYPTPPQEL